MRTAVSLLSCAILLPACTQTAPKEEKADIHAYVLPESALASAAPSPGIISGPRLYTASVLLNVTSGASPLAPSSASAEETALFIRTQIALFKHTEILDEVIRTSDLRSTEWLKSTRNPAAALRAAIAIDHLPGTSLMRLSLSLPQRQEVDRIANIAAEVYIQYLDKAYTKQRETDMRAFREQVATTEKILLRATQEAEDYRALHEINTLVQTYSAGMSALTEFENELGKLVIERALVQKKLDEIKQQQADPEYKLPAELRMEVDADPAITVLEKDLAGFKRDLEIEKRTRGDATPLAKELSIKVEVFTRDLIDTRTKLETKAKERQLTQASASLRFFEDRLAGIKKSCDEKQAMMRKLDGDLNQNRAREEAVRAAREEYNRAHSEYLRQDAIARSMQSRIQVAARARPVSVND